MKMTKISKALAAVAVLVLAAPVLAAVPAPYLAAAREGMVQPHIWVMFLSGMAMLGLATRSGVSVPLASRAPAIPGERRAR